jgi:hypothetical protein
MKKKLLAATALAAISTLMGACSSVSLTHANGSNGQSVTHTEVEPNNTVVLTYPNGSACIDTNPGESRTCK